MDDIFVQIGHPRPLAFLSFHSFQTNVKHFTANKCENYPSKILRWGSNSQPLNHESIPKLTIKPGLHQRRRYIPGGFKMKIS